MREIMKRHMGLWIYFLVWGLLVLYFWLRTDPDGLGYSLITFYMVLPVSALLVSARYGMRKDGRKWLLIPFFGGMEVLAGAVTFDLANTISTGNWNMPCWEMAWLSVVPSLLGLAVTAGIRFLHMKHTGGGVR